jgi:hypothetical protein
MLSSASSAIALLGGVALMADTASAANPNLSGIWGGAVVTTGVTAGDPNAKIDQKTFETLADQGSNRYTARNDLAGQFNGVGGARWIAHEADKTVRRRGALNKPVYKPEFWDRIALNDYNANVGGEWIEYADPTWKNLPPGVPRMGAPSKILQTDNEVVFLYSSRNQFRIIPTDCRPFDPVLEYDTTYMGVAVGCWENGSLVVHSKGFNDITWLDETGWSHSDQMEVWEKFTLQADGKRMLYEVRVEDPVMFVTAWVKEPQTLNLETNPKAVLLEDPPYFDQALGAMALPRDRGF